MYWRVIAREPPPILPTPHLVHFAIIHLLVTVYSHVIHPKEKRQLNRWCRPRLPCFIRKPTQVRGYMPRKDHPPTSPTESLIVHPSKKYPWVSANQISTSSPTPLVLQSFQPPFFSRVSHTWPGSTRHNCWTCQRNLPVASCLLASLA